MERGKGMKFVGDSRIKMNGRMENISEDYSEYPGKTESFLPNFLLKEWMVGAVFLVGFLCLCIADPPPLESEADPTAAGYTPLPDWYFLFLYQLLKYHYASGDFVIFGVIIIPALGILALILAPWLDTGPERRLFKRPVAAGMMLLATISLFYLTWESVETHNWKEISQQGEITKGGTPDVDIDKSSDGYKIFSNQTCVNCHGENLEGGQGPPLVTTDKSAKEIKDIAKHGTGSMPPGQFKGSDEKLDKLAKFIEKTAKKGNEQAGG